MSRLSGLLLDRIDLHVDVPALSYEQIADKEASGPTSAEVRVNVQAAREHMPRSFVLRKLSPILMRLKPIKKPLSSKRFSTAPGTANLL